MEVNRCEELVLLGNCFFGRGLTRILDGFEFVHDQETAGDLSLRLYSFTIGDRSLSDGFMKESAEGAETLKADFETDIGHPQLVVAEQLFRFLDATLDEVLVRGLVERLPKQTQKVIARETSLLRDLIQTQRMVVAVIDKVTRTTKPLKCFEIRFDSSNHESFNHQDTKAQNYLTEFVS